MLEAAGWERHRAAPLAWWRTVRFAGAAWTRSTVKQQLQGTWCCTWWWSALQPQLHGRQCI